MRTKKITLIVLSFIVFSCSTREVDELEIQPVEANTELKSEGNLVSIEDFNTFTADLKKTSAQQKSPISVEPDINCGIIEQSLTIAWTSVSITDERKAIVRAYFERDFGKHPVTGIYPDGIRELWYFDPANISPGILEKYRAEGVVCADDVVKAAIMVEDDVELDD